MKRPRTRAADAFARAMERIARDPDARRVNAEIARDFNGTDGDRLEDLPWTGGRPEEPVMRAPRGKRKGNRM
jgi:hypothetical protein